MDRMDRKPDRIVNRYLICNFDLSLIVSVIANFLCRCFSKRPSCGLGNDVLDAGYVRKQTPCCDVAQCLRVAFCLCSIPPMRWFNEEPLLENPHLCLAMIGLNLFQRLYRLLPGNMQSAGK